MHRLTRRRLLGAGAAGAVGGIGLVGSAASSADARQSTPEWRSYGFDDGNTGFARNTDAPASDVGVPWRFEAGDPERRTQPVIMGDLFFLNANGVLHARDLDTRSHAWRQDLNGGVDATPAVAGGYLYAAGDAMYGLDVGDGSIRWRAETAGPVGTPVTVGTSPGRPAVYAGTEDGVLHAFSPADGTEYWRKQFDAPMVNPVAVRGERVFAGVGQRVVAMDVADGATQWTAEADGRVVGPVVDRSEQVLFGTTAGAVESRHVSDGSRLSSKAFEEQPVAPPTAVKGELVVFPHGRTLSVLGLDGSEVERYRLPNPVATAASFGGANGVFVVGDDAGAVHGFELGGGPEPIWTHRTGGGLDTPPALAAGRAYVHAENGLVALDPDWAGREVTVTSVPPVESTRTDRPATPRATATTAPGGGTAGERTPAEAVAEPNPDPSQTLPLPDGLPVLPISGATLLGAAGLAALARRAVGSDDDEGPGSGGSSGSSGASSSGGTSGPSAPSGTASARQGSSTAGGTASGGSATSTTSRGAPTSGGAGGSATAGGSERGTRSLPYPVGDTSGRPETVPTTLDLDCSYEDIDRGDRIGTGGNADVYRATAPGPDGPVDLAVKEPRVEGTLHAETVERVVREAETWADLDEHDHVVGVLDWGSEPLPWIAMEYMDAGHLGEWLDGERSLVERLWVGYAVVQGVRHAHRHGVAHLDLKPENVLFRSTGPETWPVPKVADWGLSKHLLEHSNSVEGLTPAYAAPEQFESDRGEPDNVTDVYQLGAVLYELFAGRPPFEGAPTQVMHGVLHDEPEPPSAHAPGLTDAVDEMVLRALATDRSERYDSVLYLRDDIREIVQSL